MASSVYTRAELKETLKSLLRDGIVTVTFEKAGTGSKRDMVCTLAPRFIEALNDPKPAPSRSRKAPNPDVCVVFDVEREGWRSFRYDSIIQFKTVNGTWEPKEVFVTEVVFTPSED